MLTDLPDPLHTPMPALSACIVSASLCRQFELLSSQHPVSRQHSTRILKTIGSLCYVLWGKTPSVSCKHETATRQLLTRYPKSAYIKVWINPATTAIGSNAPSVKYLATTISASPYAEWADKPIYPIGDIQPPIQSQRG
jgi:hypothetical protein